MLSSIEQSPRRYARTGSVGLIFFGFACLCRGYLICGSGYFPRIFGVLMALAGVSYLGNSLALLLAPALASALFPAILVPAFVGELSFALWLTFKGANLQQWARSVAMRP